MRILGIVGGLGPESSALYYRLAQQEVRARRGGRHTARLILDSLDFADLAEAQDRDDPAAVERLVVASARRLEAAGAERVLIACNTVHCVADAVERVLDVPFLHVADAAGAALRRDGRRRVALLGTRFTMQGGFLDARLAERFGVATVVPETPDQERLHRIIQEELLLGVCAPGSRAWLGALTGRLAERGAEAVLLACTELGLLLPEPPAASGLALPVYDSARLHVAAAVAEALGEDPGRPEDGEPARASA
jgi:aspartate racemase